MVLICLCEAVLRFCANKNVVLKIYLEAKFVCCISVHAVLNVSSLCRTVT